MININLLPEEFHRSQRTSPKLLGALLLGSILAFGSAATVAYLFFTVRADKLNRIEIANEHLANLRPQAQYSDKLEGERTEFETRNQTIQEIAESRVLWTGKCDRLSEIVNRDVSTGRHMVWLESLKIEAKPGSRAPGVNIKGFSAGSSIENVANFHEDLQLDESFARGFEGFTAPKSKLNDPDEGFEPADKYQFDFKVTLPSKDPRARR